MAASSAAGRRTASGSRISRQRREAPALWTVGPDGDGAKKVLEERRPGSTGTSTAGAGYTRADTAAETELVAVDLETGEERSLFVGPVMEIDVAPDGSAVSFCFGRGHMAMGLAVLQLEPPSDPDGFRRPSANPSTWSDQGTWHVHNGGWSADSKQLVYTQDMDYGDIYELVERQ